MELSKRSPEEVVKAHLDAINASDLDLIMRDYADDVVFASFEGAQQGKEAARAMFAGLGPLGLKFELDKLVTAGEIVYVDWHAEGPTLKVEGGTDTFVVRNGLITGQTAKAAFTPK
jgi:ketosteroid isomerase-like protein